MILRDKDYILCVREKKTIKVILREHQLKNIQGKISSVILDAILAL